MYQAEALSLIEEAAALLKKEIMGLTPPVDKEDNTTAAPSTKENSSKVAMAKEAIKVSVNLAKEEDKNEAPEDEMPPGGEAPDEDMEMNDHGSMLPPHERKKSPFKGSLKDLPAHPGPPPMKPPGPNGHHLYREDEDRMQAA